VKTHPHLLVRDTLAELFVRAARGDAEARETVRELEGWSRGESCTPRLLALAAEDGEPIFSGDGLAERFAPLADWVRDRAERYGASCGWIETEAVAADPVECARAAWDAGLFFEVHELIEPVWLEEKGERRTGLQGLIMAGAALHHLVEGNLPGAGSLLLDAARHLRSAPREERFDLETFASALAGIGERVKSGEISGIEDLEDLPRLERRGD
jgi:alkanesulfonate monooxygenase SsuD/methylene tetrahydromethanopterin reductase-like flavin-dependent oxidoreductase (luciferase family)